MDLFICAAYSPETGEHELAYRLLALVTERVFGLTALPELAREGGGKPFFPARPDICFNLSHSRGAAVCAMHERPVGIDM